MSVFSRPSVLHTTIDDVPYSPTPDPFEQSDDSDADTLPYPWLLNNIQLATDAEVEQPSQHHSDYTIDAGDSSVEDAVIMPTRRRLWADVVDSDSDSDEPKQQRPRIDALDEELEQLFSDGAVDVEPDQPLNITINDESSTRQFELPVRGWYSVRALRHIISRELNIHIDTYVLLYKGAPLRDSVEMNTMGVVSGDTMHIVMRPPTVFPVFVATLTQGTMTLSMSPADDIEAVSARIAFCTGVRRANFGLVFNGAQLQCSSLVSDVGIVRDSTVRMVLTLGGGVPYASTSAERLKLMEYDADMRRCIKMGLPVSPPSGSSSSDDLMLAGDIAQLSLGSAGAAPTVPHAVAGGGGGADPLLQLADARGVRRPFADVDQGIAHSNK